MKILFIIRSLNYGGAERQLVNLAIGLKKKGHDVSVAVFYANGALQKELDENGVSVLLMEKKGRWDIVSFFFSLRRLIKKNQPDIVHGYTVVPNCLTLLARVFHPKSKVVWGVRASNMDLSKYDWLARLFYRLECFLSRYADLVIANSNAGREYACLNGFPREKVQVVHNGINIEKFSPRNEDRIKIRQKLGISDDSTLIGCVGRLDPMKGYPIFIDAMSYLIARSDKFFAVAIGNGNDNFSLQLKDKVVELGISNNFLWIPSRDDIARYYNAFDVLVSPSLTEGFPNVIAEAMSCGIPCVVTNVGDSAFLVGECGIVVPPHDSIALTDAITEMLEYIENSKDKLMLCARERVVGNFTVEKLVENTEVCLKSVGHLY